MTKRAAPKDLASVFANRWVKLVVLVLCAALLCRLLYRLRGILVPFGLAVVAAYVVNPLVTHLQARLKWKRIVVVVAFMTLVTLVAVGVLALGAYYTVTSVQEMVPAARRALSGGPRGNDLWDKVQGAIEAIPNEIRVHFQINQTI